MDPLQPNTALLPPALRALALGLLIETVVPLLNRGQGEGPAPPGPGESGEDPRAELWQALRGKCDELSALGGWYAEALRMQTLPFSACAPAAQLPQR